MEPFTSNYSSVVRNKLKISWNSKQYSSESLFGNFKSSTKKIRREKILNSFISLCPRYHSPIFPNYRQWYRSERFTLHPNSLKYTKITKNSIINPSPSAIREFSWKRINISNSRNKKISQKTQEEGKILIVKWQFTRCFHITNATGLFGYNGKISDISVQLSAKFIVAM